MTNFSQFKKITDSLVLLSGLIFCLGARCTNVLNGHGIEATGAIYGNLRINSANLSPAIATVYIEGTGLSTKPDSSGIFYFPKVQPGRYNVIGRAPELTDYIIEGVDVQADSISIVSIFSIGKGRFPERQQWRRRRLLLPGQDVQFYAPIIKRVDLSERGSMAGKVHDLDAYFEPISKAGIIIPGTLWATSTDSSGNYRIDNILPGRYVAIGHAARYHGTIIYDIRIAADSTSIVDFGLIDDAILEKPFPREWRPQFKKAP